MRIQAFSGEPMELAILMMSSALSGQKFAVHH
jgi:hypothetical protein